MPVHDTLFTVFRQPDTNNAYAVGQSDGKCLQVEVTSKGYSVSDKALSVAVTKISANLRRGYSQIDRPMYFNERSGEFTLIHPDLSWKGLDWVLAAVVPDLTVASGIVGEMLLTLPSRIIFPEEVQAWQAQQSKNAAHVVAFNDMPIWSLVLAQAAMDNGWALRASGAMGSLPFMPPSISPTDWAKWLSPAFTERSIADAQRALGWTVGALLIADQTLTPDASNLAGFL